MQADIVLCGAGIAGVSAAWHLAARHGARRVLLVDERAPLSLTSDRSTECYRNWWPGPDDALIRLMERSIDLLEALARETGNVFHLNRRGYLYAAGPEGVGRLCETAEAGARQGVGPLRRHAGRAGGSAYRSSPPSGFEGQPTGADLILEPALIRRQFPYLSPHVAALLHVRRAGWLSGQQLGACLLERARAAGVRLLRARVEGVETQAGRVHAVRVRDEAGEQAVRADVFINAAGPSLRAVGKMTGEALPVFTELHARAVCRDTRGVVPRDAPLLIWTEPQHLPWTEEEQALLAATEETRRLLAVFPPGVHVRPEGGPQSDRLLMLWGYHTPPVAPVWPPEFEPHYAEVVLRGLSPLLPGLWEGAARAERPRVDGGYYTKTPENRPLIGPLSMPGAYVLGALSGYGLMAACAAGELLACHVTGSPLPAYAPAFAPDRHADPAYRSRMAFRQEAGQL